MLLCIMNEIGIERKAGKGGAIANYHELFAGTGEGYVGAAQLGKKTNSAIGIAAGKRNINGITFLALEGVNGIYSKSMQEGLERRVYGNGFLESFHLVAVRCNNTNGGKVGSCIKLL